MCVKNQRGVLTHRSASPTMPTGTAPVNLTFCTRGPAATIRTAVSGVLAAPSSRPRRQLHAETSRLKRPVQPRLGRSLLPSRATWTGSPRQRPADATTAAMQMSAETRTAIRKRMPPSAYRGRS